MNIEVTCPRLQKGEKKEQKIKGSQNLLSSWKTRVKNLFIRRGFFIIIIIILIIIIIINLHAKYLHDFSPMQHNFHGFEYRQQRFLYPSR